MKTLKFAFALPIAFVGLIFINSCSKSDEGATPNDNVKVDIVPGTVLKVSSVNNFTWITGNSSFKADSENRLWSSKFTFKSGNNFTYTFKWDNSTLYTLNGEYFKKSGTGYAFYAAISSNNGAGSGTQIIVEGTIVPLSNKQYQMNMEYGAGAYYAANVNNQQFFSQSSKRFKTVMILE